ncbi:MAG: trypsin-like peptidase domain-containing protein [Deltaproteobacteria bacterium]|nr:trypsin-like peptidase domain-containing protein [Deltaproteobacteria bacterium]
MAHKDGDYYPSGTAIIISKFMAITAKHVILDFYYRLDKKSMDNPAGNLAGTFNLQVFQILNNGKTGRVWNVTKLWLCNFTDIAVLMLIPVSKEALDYRWSIPILDLIPPEIGERVFCFGYRKPKITKNGNTIEWIVDPITSTVSVKCLHHEKRDSCRLSFPCFQIDARFDGAMSGGPVFNDSGKLCGIICSNLPPTSDEEEHVSYVTSLWPLMALEIDINRKGHPKGIHYPILELVQDNFVRAVGWEKIKLIKDKDGHITNMVLRQKVWKVRLTE